MTANFKTPPLRDRKYLDSYGDGAFCAVCNTQGKMVIGAHIRYHYFGIGKPDDNLTLPLCGHHHTIQHNIGEVQFWRDVLTNPNNRDLADHLMMSALKALARERYKERDNDD